MRQTLLSRAIRSRPTGVPVTLTTGQPIRWTAPQHLETRQQPSSRRVSCPALSAPEDQPEDICRIRCRPRDVDADACRATSRKPKQWLPKESAKITRRSDRLPQALRVWPIHVQELPARRAYALVRVRAEVITVQRDVAEGAVTLYARAIRQGPSARLKAESRIRVATTSVRPNDARARRRGGSARRPPAGRPARRRQSARLES